MDPLDVGDVVVGRDFITGHRDWQKVYCEGCDSKYGTMMVSCEMRAWRHPTFFEFYGGAAID